MNFFYQVLIGIALVAAGILGNIYTQQTVRIFGQFDWQVKYFGSGGGYTFVRLLGILLIVLGFLFTFGFMRSVVG